MDQTTDAVRRMYEAYPYPATTDPEMRAGTNVRLLLSYGALARDRKRPLHCLDAGCGRGNGALGAAAIQPDVRFTAIDVNRRALAEAAARATALGLRNITFHEVDLMTLDGLEVPAGGFDVIVSSGVLHHLSSPDEGLARLRSVLAPHGILSLMVYGTAGRESLYRMVKAVDILVPRDRPLADRLAHALRLAAESGGEAVRVGPAGVSDGMAQNEFVDRYLNVNETSYDVAGVFDLLSRHGLAFLRWVEPRDWEVPSRGPAPSHVADHLAPLDRYRLVEQLTWRHKLELVAGTSENSLRELPPRQQWPALAMGLNPEVSFRAETRALRGSQRLEALGYRLRNRDFVELTGLAASLAAAVKDRTSPFPAREALGLLHAARVPADQALDTLGDLLAREIVYVPHPAEV